MTLSILDLDRWIIILLLLILILLSFVFGVIAHTREEMFVTRANM